jgi:hypothetical protein
MNYINGYINPFSDRFKQATEEFTNLKRFEQFVTISLTIITGLGTLFFGGIGGFATFRLLVDRFKIKKLESPYNETINKTINSTAYLSSLNRKSETTNRTGSICITTQTGGYIGSSSQRPLLSVYLEKREDYKFPVFTTEDGDPLILNSNDFVIEFHLHKTSKSLENTRIPPSFFLPAALFKGKKEGDSLRLKYNEELIELTLDQSQDLKFAHSSFEEAFEAQKAYIQEDCDIERPLFGIHDKYWWYKLGEDGEIYGLSEKDNKLSLKQKKASAFREKISPMEPTMYITQSEDKKEVDFNLEVPGFKLEDIDIIVNKKYLIFYTYPSSFDSGWRKQWLVKRESLISFRWDKHIVFKKLDIEQMKAKVSQGKASLRDGMLTFTITTD